MNTWSFIPVMLMALLGVCVAGGTALVLLVSRARQRILSARSDRARAPERPCPFETARAAGLCRPNSWLAVRSHNLAAVQAAFGLHHAKPCSWLEGLMGDKKLFIAPPVNGWILIFGSGLPEPGEDIDACFRFLLELSRKLGQVQFFSVNRVVNHHAWAWLEAGRVVRAYAWAERTLWTQGIKTRAELELGLKCFGYLETRERRLFGQPDVLATNTEKVPLLAARWSIDPAAVDGRIVEQMRGIAGEPSHFY